MGQVKQELQDQVDQLWKLVQAKSIPLYGGINGGDTLYILAALDEAVQFAPLGEFPALLTALDNQLSQEARYPSTPAEGVAHGLVIFIDVLLKG